MFYIFVKFKKINREIILKIYFLKNRSINTVDFLANFVLRSLLYIKKSFSNF